MLPMMQKTCRLLGIVAGMDLTHFHMALLEDLPESDCSLARQPALVTLSPFRGVTPLLQPPAEPLQDFYFAAGWRNISGNVIVMG